MLVKDSAKVPTTGIDEDAVELEGKVSLVKEVGEECMHPWPLVELLWVP